MVQVLGRVLAVSQKKRFVVAGFHRRPFRGNRWVSLVDDLAPQGKPGIAILFSSKTTNKLTPMVPSVFAPRPPSLRPTRCYVSLSLRSWKLRAALQGPTALQAHEGHALEWALNKLKWTPDPCEGGSPERVHSSHVFCLFDCLIVCLFVCLFFLSFFLSFFLFGGGHVKVGRSFLVACFVHKSPAMHNSPDGDEDTHGLRVERLNLQL